MQYVRRVERLIITRYRQEYTVCDHVLFTCIYLKVLTSSRELTISWYTHRMYTATSVLFPTSFVKCFIIFSVSKSIKTNFYVLAQQIYFEIRERLRTETNRIFEKPSLIEKNMNNKCAIHSTTRSLKESVSLLTYLSGK